MEVKGTPRAIVLAHGKRQFQARIGDLNTIRDLRVLAQEHTGVPMALQKLAFKGPLRDDEKTCLDAKIGDNSKIMVIGSTLDAVMKVNQTQESQKAEASNASAAAAAGSSEEAVQEETKHQKHISQGPPMDAMPGLKEGHESLPEGALTGVLNNIGMKVRLTFKKFTEELWIQSSSSTQKLHFSQVRKVVAERIKDHPEYHMVGLQLSATSTLWFYWVPSQYVQAIKYSFM